MMDTNDLIFWELQAERERMARAMVAQRELLNAARLAKHAAQPPRTHRALFWTGGVLIGAGRRLQQRQAPAHG